VSGSDDLLHDLNDRLNGIMISVELALRLLQQKETREVAQILTRLREDSVVCNNLVSDLRKSHSRDE
jgi:signal transduction histidine kinase